MNVSCSSDYEEKINLSGMTLADLHRSKEEVLKSLEEVIVTEDKYYNGEKKETPIKMK